MRACKQAHAGVCVTHVREKEGGRGGKDSAYKQLQACALHTILLQHAGAGTRRICVRKRENVRKRMCAMRWNSRTKKKIEKKKEMCVRKNVPSSLVFGLGEYV